jgi:hypothetical protein
MDRPGIGVRLPAGYHPTKDEIRPLDDPPLYAELAMSVPGVPQGSLVHYTGLVKDMRRVGFHPSAPDPCLFVHTSGKMAVVMHVDDGILACPSTPDAEWFVGKQGLGATRVLTWGPLDHTLGVEFDIKYTPTKRTVFMHQGPYARNVVRRAGCKTVTTPAVPGRKYTKEDAPADLAEVQQLEREGLSATWYKSVAASTNFLRTMTRLDLAFAQGKNAKACSNPGREHFLALKHQVRFIAGTPDYGIKFEWLATDKDPPDGPLTITCFSDSSFADDPDTGKSIFVNGAAILARSKLTPTVDSCINHSELEAYMDVTGTGETTDKVDAFMHAGRTLKWVRAVKAALEQRDENGIPPTPVMVDNAGVISIINDSTMKTSNRHIYRAIYEVRQRVHQEKVAYPVKIGTKDNVANALTKQESALQASAEQLRCIAGPHPGRDGE